MGGESSPKDRDAPPLLCRRRHHLQSQPEAVSQRKGRSPSLTRHRFEAYLDKVFGFSDLVSALPEGRQFPQHAWKKVFDAVVVAAAMQIPSLLQIEAECRHGALAQRIGPVRDDTLGYWLQRQAPQAVFALSVEIASRLKRNGELPYR